MDCLVGDLEAVLDMLLDDERSSANDAIRHHIAIQLATLIDETKANPRSFRKRFTALCKEIDSGARLH